MGGEWAKLEILTDFEVIVYNEKDGRSRIYPPAAYRDKILESLHKGGRKDDSMLLRARLHYYWPRMRLHIQQHVAKCKACFELLPSKSEAKMTGLGIPFSDLEPMDWLCTDLCEKKFQSGKKFHYLCIADRSSGFVRAYRLPGTKTRHIINALKNCV